MTDFSEKNKQDLYYAYLRQREELRFFYEKMKSFEFSQKIVTNTAALKEINKKHKYYKRLYWKAANKAKELYNAWKRKD
jgi:hypothetical protein